MKSPGDLPGAWSFHAPLQAAEFKVGQVWRKCGPVDALRIERICCQGILNTMAVLLELASVNRLVQSVFIGARKPGSSWARLTSLWIGCNNMSMHWPRLINVNRTC